MAFEVSTGDAEVVEAKAGGALIPVNATPSAREEPPRRLINAAVGVFNFFLFSIKFIFG